MNIPRSVIQFFNTSLFYDYGTCGSSRSTNSDLIIRRPRHCGTAVAVVRLTQTSFVTDYGTADFKLTPTSFFIDYGTAALR